jgi:5-(carboxyamino)imidazole ribonucleotide mutase|tara:strand:- start:3897 stop:4379 length:483 start_codon:yes stop_codon:yes gene_type:complete
MNIQVAIIMGSKSDWDVMSHSAEMLSNLGIQYEAKVISAHRTPDLLDEYCAKIQEKGIKVIIAGAGLAAALPGVIAAKTTIPVVGVPLVVGSLDGLDALMSIVQMPPGIPVGTMALGKPGAINAALFAAAILALTNSSIADRISAYREKQAQKILESELD